MQRLKTIVPGNMTSWNDSHPGNYRVCSMVREYQRRTLTGIGWKKKTVQRRTGKTPRTIVITLCATTSASIMVRFFCILMDMRLIQ
jgi:hypothetical protein